MYERKLPFIGSVGNDEILCPVSGVVCPAREELVKLYQEETGADLDFPKEVRPNLNSAKLQIKLAEQAIWANAVGCTGDVDGNCETRIKMNESKNRRKFVSIIRTLMGTQHG